MSQARQWLLAGSALAIAAPGLLAQRAPVLRQVKVPHPYYYREMLIPQVTSGPSALTWSPDGRELIYSMQGSLWRQRLGSTEAQQLTAGPGYDHQPDWSPDGARVVYASYRNDAMELWLLDLATGESKSLTSNGAVNLEPRWSPDGSRIAFTSSAHEGRWHVFTVAVSAGSGVGTIERVTEDRASGLPRYYYDKFDQYFSPTWSPDGRELLLISNRGHIWGSGGFRRIQATRGDSGREIRYEETNWKSRPDWSRDGRVVYSSYLGRQWHQLWLMTPQGGDPYQLTYGDFDATAPRWAPDGRRIGYISNETGNTALWVLHVFGGTREAVVAQHRKYRQQVGRLSIVVLDEATGRETPARISVTGSDGRSFAPDSAWRHADDGFDRAHRRFEYGYFHTSGRAVLTVPQGTMSIEVSRGPEYRVVRRTVDVSAGPPRSVQVTLARLDNLPARGWYSGDLHVHMNYGGAYRNDPRRLAFQARAEDLHLVENLIVNKEGRVPDVGYFRSSADPASTPGTLIFHGQEFHTSLWGHVGLLGLKRNLLLPGYSAYVNTAAASPQPTNAMVFDLAHEQGAVTGYVHPYDVYPDPDDTSRALTHHMPVDVALGKVDYYEALGFVDDYMATARVWYQFLNCGFRLPAGAGTDAMANFASLRGPVGMNRVFVQSGKPLEHRRWLAALKAGRSFATNGPLLGFTLDGRAIGDELSLPAGGRDVVARVRLRSNVPVDHLEIIGNGQMVREIPLTGARTSANMSVRLPVARSSWFLLRARSDSATYPVLDVYPYATTSPIYVIVDGKPIRSAEAAAYFIKWIDRLKTAVDTNRAWNDGEEKAKALEDVSRARAEFERRAGRSR